MKLGFFVFALSFLISLPAFSEDSESIFPEVETPGEMTANEEVEALNRLAEEEDIIDTGSTVGNGMPITPTAEQTTL